MNNYILLQNNNLKLYLLSKNGIWNTKLAGKDIQLDACIERYFAYMIIGENNISEVSATLRTYNKNITPCEIDEFVLEFIKSHPCEPCDFNLAIIPTYATDDCLLSVSNPFSYKVLLTKKQELEIISILQSDEKDKQSQVIEWFHEYIVNYGLSPKYKKDIPIQDAELALAFCREHGVNFLKLNTYTIHNNALVSKTRHLICWICHFIVAEVMFVLAWYFMSIQCFNIWPLDSNDIAIGGCIGLCAIISMGWNIWWNKSVCAMKLTYMNHLGIIGLNALFAILFAIICIPVCLICFPIFDL